LVSVEASCIFTAHARVQITVRPRLLIPVAFDLRDPDRSGIARVARSIARAFTENASDRFTVTLCGPRSTLLRLGADAWGPARIVDWPSGRLSPRTELTWDRIRRLVGDAVWYFPHWDVPWHAMPARSIITVHDLTALRVPGATTPIRRELSRFWIRRSARRASFVVAVSNFSRNEIVKEWPDLADKTRVIYNGVDPTFFTTPEALPPRIRQIAGQGSYMVSVGNKKPHKNLVMGAEVLSRLPNLRWIVVGEQFRGWEQVTRRIDELGVGDRVHVLEPQSDAVLHALYASASCLFFPSRHEGFGLPILEALAAGTRVVAGAAGASIEILAGHGAVCPVDNADSFAAAVDAAVRAPTPPDRSGRDLAATFTWSRAARQLTDLIEAAAG
jgi:glycosyltransferase involved in cell wall biosynthesis